MRLNDLEARTADKDLELRFGDDRAAGCRIAPLAEDALAVPRKIESRERNARVRSGEAEVGVEATVYRTEVGFRPRHAVEPRIVQLHGHPRTARRYGVDAGDG